MFQKSSNCKIKKQKNKQAPKHAKKIKTNNVTFIFAFKNAFLLHTQKKIKRQILAMVKFDCYSFIKKIFYNNNKNDKNNNNKNVIYIYVSY